MPNGRFISKSISVSEQLGNVSLEADFLFGRCIPHLDVEGRITGNPKGLKAVVCPLRDELTHQKITHLLKELHEAGLCVWYEVNGSKFLEFPTFSRHQPGMKKEREADSKIPSSKVKAAQAVTESWDSHKDVIRTNSGLNPDQLTPKLSEVKVSKVKESEVKGSDAGASGSKLSLLSQADCEMLRQGWAKRIGIIEYPRFRKAILPIFSVPDPPSVEEVANAIEAAGEWWVEADDRDQQFFTPETFRGQFAKWIRFGKMPLVDPDTRDLTERGAWAGSKALREQAKQRRFG